MIEAMFCSEERYTTLTIYFDTMSLKKEICDTMDELLPSYDLSPEITIRPVNAQRRGELMIEFHDDYTHNAQPLIDELTKRLNLTFLPCTL